METRKQKSQWVASEIQLSYRSKVKVADRPKITCSAESHQFLKANWDISLIDLVEQFKVIFLDRSNRVIGIYQLSTGGITSTVVDPRLVFIAALKVRASSIILSHNHPSGNLTTSQADINLTKKLIAAGALLDIRVLDHLIITGEGYMSLGDQGVLQNS